jgi:hypothetical protein
MKLRKQEMVPMNLAIPDVRNLEIHPPTFGYLSPSCRRSTGLGRNELGVPLLIQAIRDAADLGYNFLSIAGEQAVFYPELSTVCREAHEARMLTTLTTRAGLLSNGKLKSLIPSLDLLGIIFERGMARELDAVRRSGIPFALVFPLTSANMAELETAAAFAARQGAQMLRVRPSGRFSDDEMATVWMMIECLRDVHRGELALQLEVLNRYHLPFDASDLDGWMAGVERDVRFLGDLISPLVVEEDGTVAPLRHGFPRWLALGNLGESTMEEMASGWIRDGAAIFCAIYHRVLRNARLFDDLNRLLAEEAGRDRGASFSAAG